MIVEDAKIALLSLMVLLLVWFKVMVIGKETVPLTENDVVTPALVLADCEEPVLVDVLLDVTLAGPESVADCARAVAQRVRINTKRAAIIIEQVGLLGRRWKGLRGELVKVRRQKSDEREFGSGADVAIWTDGRRPAQRPRPPSHWQI